jgi:hypothetical protein
MRQVAGIRRSLTLFRHTVAMLHAHKFRPPEEPGAEIVAFPAASAPAPTRKPFDLVVDLANEPLGPRWWRGAATLALLCGSALMLSPGFQRLAPSHPAVAVPVDPAGSGMLAFQALGDEPATPAAAPQAQQRGIAVGEQGGLKRVSGDISGGLYWSLRDAGASPDVAAEYLKAIATRIDVGEVAPFDRFEFVVGDDGETLVFAGLRRAMDSDVELMKWNSGGRNEWFGADAAQGSSSAFMTPVDGRISSGFGRRVHPILRYSRFHSGLDFAAGSGSPVVAAADGQVVGAGWTGGYGRQVRVAHGGGVVTSYSHLSGIAAAPGTPVRQGEVIGYVGSSGLSTGPHLHFEVRVSGRPVNPLAARLVRRPVLEGSELAAFKARLRELKAIALTPVASAQG